MVFLPPTQWLGNDWQAWSIALGVAFGTWLLLTFARKLVLARLPKLLEHSNLRWPEGGLVFVRSLGRLFIAVMAIYAGVHVLDFGPKVTNTLFKVAFLVFLWQLGISATALIRYWVDYQIQTRPQVDGGKAQSLRAIGFLVTLVLYATLVLWALDNFGVNITTLVAGLGVGGIAVALAVQNILGDLFASLTIVLDKPFVYGDFVTVGDFRGTIEHVGLKTTRIRSLSGEQVIFPNADLLQSRIRNFKRMEQRRIEFQVGVTYDTSLDALQTVPVLIKELVESQPRTRFERAHFMNFGASSLDFEVIYWVLSPEFQVFRDIHQAILLQMVKAFRDKGVEFAFPTRTIHLESSGPLTS